MCGIAGSFHPETDTEDPWVAEALDRIAHRGPDGRGIQTWTAATHGHVRLAIMDPQPRSDCPFIYGGVILSYVGECWNYRELRAELEADGMTFTTTGDTEVVAALLHWTFRHGRDFSEALQRLEGQYAFAWTESLTGKTWLARDRFGEVPLYVLESEAQSLFDESTGILWASERKAFGERAADARPVPAGSVWQLGGGIPEVYYEPARDATDRRKMAGGPEDVRGLLERAVERRLQADVPVCCLISGGVDSASILAMVKERKPDVVAYTIVFDPDSEDRAQARFIANELGVELREVPHGAPSPEDLRRAIYTIEITMKAQIEIALHCLPLAQRIYADGFRVVLSGEGADELFGGYGMLARHSKKDGGRAWPKTRLAGVEKMSRGNFVRINKAFFAHGVEARTPFMDRDLIEGVLPLYRDECPEQKVLLREAVRGLLPEETRTRRKVSFQSGSGIRDHQAAVHGGDQQKAYNRIARELFGGLPRG